jgi:alpha-ketoglutarate-dependent taurine dioxygenase
MKMQDSKKPSLGKLPSTARRKAVRVSAEDLVQEKPLNPGQPMPLMISPTIEELDLVTWVENNRDRLEQNLQQHAAVLFRGFHINTPTAFKRFVDSQSQALLDYDYGLTPRSQVSEKVYTSTEYPPHQFIPPHNEKSYDTQWPMKIWFCCLQVAAEGGETPIYDSRRVLERITPAVREKFDQKKVMYMRNYSEKLDVPWQKVFGTENKTDVENFCRQHNIAFEWKNGDELRTRQICQAIATHPQTGEKVWFNQAHLFHVSGLPQTVQEMLLAEFEEEDLPRNVYYGDGSPIEQAALEEIRAAYKDEYVAFPWQEGDLLMVDNMLVAHGRNPFTGPRQIIVAMAESFTVAP